MQSPANSSSAQPAQPSPMVDTEDPNEISDEYSDDDDPGYRIVLVEDVGELYPDVSYRLRRRAANSETAAAMATPAPQQDAPSEQPPATKNENEAAEDDGDEDEDEDEEEDAELEEDESQQMDTGDAATDGNNDMVKEVSDAMITSGSTPTGDATRDVDGDTSKAVVDADANAVVEGADADKADQKEADKDKGVEGGADDVEEDGVGEEALAAHHMPDLIQGLQPMFVSDPAPDGAPQTAHGGEQAGQTAAAAPDATTEGTSEGATGGAGHGAGAVAKDSAAKTGADASAKSGGRGKVRQQWSKQRGEESVASGSGDGERKGIKDQGRGAGPRADDSGVSVETEDGSAEGLRNWVVAQKGTEDALDGADDTVYYDCFDLKIVYERNRTGFEETKDYPIEINGVIAGRYQILEFLGAAAFSKAVQCVDLTDGSYVCIKIIKNNKDFFDQSLDEIKILKYINAHDTRDDHHLLQLYDYFYFKEHLFIVTELLRDNLYEFSKFNRESGAESYFTMPRLQKIARECLFGLKFVHALGLIHCDLKPENVLIRSYSRCEIKIIDFGSSCFVTDHLTSYVQSRSYRAPEVILGLPYDQQIDMWSLGCILAELWTGRVLFQNDSLATLLARVVGILGGIDENLLLQGRYTHRFFTKHKILYDRMADEDRSLVYIFPKRSTLKHRLGTEDALFINFLEQLLSVDPAKRSSASEALQHPWLSKSYV